MVERIAEPVLRAGSVRRRGQILARPNEFVFDFILLRQIRFEREVVLVQKLLEAHILQLEIVDITGAAPRRPVQVVVVVIPGGREGGRFRVPHLKVVHQMLLKSVVV